MEVRCQVCGALQSRGFIPDERSRLKHILFHGTVLGVCASTTKLLFVRVWHASESWLNLAAAFGICVLLLIGLYAAVFLAEVIVVWRLRCQSCGRRRLSSVLVAIDEKPQTPPEIIVGALYAVRRAEGDYQIVKLLAADDEAVHLRLYANHFKEIPARVSSSELSLDSFDDPGACGIGHFPLARAGFGNQAHVLLGVEPIADEELEGYRIWAGMDSVDE